MQFQARYWDKISPEAKDLVVKMLNRDPRLRFSAREALNHTWFQSDAEKAANQLPVLENIANLEQEMRVDPRQLNNADVNMLTCTPVLAGRVLGGHVPQSPFLLSNQNRNDATPIMPRMQVRQNGDSAQMNMMNGIVFNRPMFGVNPAAAGGQPGAPPGKPNNPYEVAPVPQFKKAGPAP